MFHNHRNAKINILNNLIHNKKNKVRPNFTVFYQRKIINVQIKTVFDTYLNVKQKVNVVYFSLLFVYISSGILH